MSHSISFYDLADATATATAQPPESADGIVISYGDEGPRITPLSAEERAWQAALSAEASGRDNGGLDTRPEIAMSNPETEPEVAPEPEEAPLPEPEDDPDPMEPAGRDHTPFRGTHDSEVARYFRHVPPLEM